MVYDGQDAQADSEELVSNPLLDIVREIYCRGGIKWVVSNYLPLRCRTLVALYDASIIQQHEQQATPRRP
jgi:hypothetical protein